MRARRTTAARDASPPRSVVTPDGGPRRASPPCFRDVRYALDDVLLTLPGCAVVYPSNAREAFDGALVRDGLR